MLAQSQQQVTWSPRSADGEVVSQVELSVSTPSGDGVPVVSVSGEVDVYSASALRDGLTDLIEKGEGTVVVDLTKVGFLDSTGLGALVAARSRAGELGGELPLVCTHDRILKLFTITGLDGVFDIYRTVDEARQAIADSSDEG